MAVIRGSARRPSGAILVPVAAYALVSVTSAALSSDPRHSVTELADLLTLGLVPMAISLLDQRRSDRLLLLLAAILGVSSIFGLAQYAFGGDPLQHRMRGLATHYMTFSGWTLTVTLLLLGEVFFGRERRRLLWSLPAVALGGSTLLLGLTRGAWIGLAAGLLLALAAGRPRAMILLPVAATFLYLILPQPVLSRAASTIDFENVSTRERIHMFRAGIEMVRDHPLLGLGPGLVQPAYDDYRASDAPPRIPHLHNNAIQIAAERGLAGLVVYVATLAVFTLHAWRASRSAGPRARALILGCLMAVVGVTAAGFFEYNWGDAEVWIVTLVCLSTPFALALRRVA